MLSVLVLWAALLSAPMGVSATSPDGLARPVARAVVFPTVEHTGELYLEQARIEHIREADVEVVAADARLPAGTKWWWVVGAIAVKVVILVLVL